MKNRLVLVTSPMRFKTLFVARTASCGIHKLAPFVFNMLYISGTAFLMDRDSELVLVDT